MQKEALEGASFFFLKLAHRLRRVHAESAR
jgi:hypothetical protein